MQWPPTRPGRKGRKFHLLPAACSTAWVSMPILLKMMRELVDEGDVDVALGVLDDLGGFGHLDALGLVGADDDDLAGRAASTSSATSGVEPEVTFLMVETRCSLSPGLMRSGL